MVRKQDHKLNDTLVFIALCPIIAVLTVHIGNENTFWELLQIPSYYTDLLLSFILTFGTAYYLKRVTGLFFNTTHNMWSKLLLYGVLIPTVFIIGIECVYLVFLIDIPLEESSVFYLELPLVVIFCVLFVLVFLFLYSHKYTSSQQETTKSEGLLVYKGNQVFRLEQNDMAYAMSSGRNTFIVDKSGKQYLINTSLKRVEDKLSDRFFRLNRRVICCREAIVSYEKEETRKLKIILDPPIDEDQFVSKTNASAFQNWLQGI